MTTRRTLLALALAAGVSGLAGTARAEDRPVPVVASFSILGDIVKQVGGAHVAVTTLVGPDGDAHVYEPTPKDAKSLANARLLIVNGLNFETWLPRLVKSSGFKGTEVVASTGVTPRQFSEAEAEEDHEGDDHEHEHDHGTVDPHAWQDLANGVIYVDNVAKALSKIDPAHAEVYKERARAYAAELEAMNAKLKQEFAAIPEANRKIVTSHDAFGYFGAAYGITFIAPSGVSTEAEASAADVARIIDQIRRDKIKAVFVENITNPKLMDQIARETGAQVGGQLFSDALSPEGGPASSYVAMFKANAEELTKALAGS
ncbi:zinc/manganese transport system substrate-binding protein [Rhodoligotrophos appendicifer]|uniref:metal ABC transporter substrate-binding protein n=1 Tax=Rhodoligotrophos appendicifer TaxID=987056 RepID=UPI0019604CDC|nr:metal ABC transporter substrate-binding protein [Rhodoligotrophos appendicifer]